MDTLSQFDVFRLRMNIKLRGQHNQCFVVFERYRGDFRLESLGAVVLCVLMSNFVLRAYLTLVRACAPLIVRPYSAEPLLLGTYFPLCSVSSTNSHGVSCKVGGLSGWGDSANA
jgi:hypothetical protein